MKKRFTAILALVMALMLGLTACGGGKGGDETADLTGTYDITVWVSEIDGVAKLTEQQIDAFEAANPGVVINATIEGVTEADSASKMLTSVEDGADIFCFAQDQLARLVTAKALNPLGQATAAKVTEMNDAGAVGAATVGGVLYCYPLTSDNGYYMYYNKSVIPENHLDSLEDIIADCEKAGMNFSMEVENAWYTASFFFATGCTSDWTTNEEGKFTAVNDTFNSPAGIVAVKGMQKILHSKSYVGSSKATDFEAAVPSAVVVSGPWCASEVQAVLGENYGATDLPSFTVDGKSYHMASFTGNKLLGVKPQTDAKKAAVLQQLALWLTGEECQQQRFEQFNWGPSNKAVQATDAVKTNPALTALALQSAYSKPQGQIHGSWWDIGKQIATDAKATEATDSAIQAVLDTYTTSINALFQMSDDVLNAFTVIGSINGDGWSVDLPMTKQDDGSWITNEAYTMEAGVEFKVRQGKSWDVNFGGDGKKDGANFVVETAGTYKIKFTQISEEEGKVELIAQ